MTTDDPNYPRTVAQAPPAWRDSASGGGNSLPVGCKLQEYVIEGLVGEGGFGIVYLARDTQLGRVVALKEYMPASLAARGADNTVSVRSERHRETFELGRRSFVNEARLLASFDQPSLVKVYRFWEQNGTAYMVMPFYEGPTLKQWLLEHGSPDERWLLSLLHPVIDALELMHSSQCYHRDIAPDNILLLRQQATQVGAPPVTRPVLLDFGAARRVIGDATQALTVILKPGYAPIEQYAESSTMKQGAWTDVYALCAVLYAAITGRAPLASVSRMLNDDLPPAVQVGEGRYSPGFLAVIDAGLAVRPERRPQDMAALRALFVEAQGATTATLSPAPALAEATVLVPPATPVPAREPVPDAVAPAEQKKRSPVLAFAAAGVLLAGAALGWWLLGRPPAPEAIAAAPLPAPPPPVAASAPPPVPFSVMAALHDIVRRADPLLGVNAFADKSTVTIGSDDRLQFRVKSAEAGHVYVFLSGTDKSHFYLLFPNEIDKDNRIDAGRELLLPRKSWQITPGGPPGTNHIVVVVSRNPRDLSGVGLRGAGEEIPEFDLARAEQLWLGRQGDASPFVGKASCDNAAPCDPAYGATLLEIDEMAPRGTGAAR